MRDQLDKAIVLGARGFIGGEIADLLRKNPSLEVIPLGSKECDLTMLDHVREKLSPMAKGAHIVMCSAILRLPGEPRRVFDANVSMAQNIVTALKTIHIKSFIFLSSTDVYGRPPSEIPMRESSPAKPTGAYGESKLVSEGILRDGFDCPLAILRLPGVYGRSDKGNSIVGAFLKKILNDEAITLDNGGRQLRDYIHAENVAQIVEALILNPRNTLLNLATGSAMSISEVVDVIGTALGKTARKVVVGNPNPSYDFVFDVSRLKETLPHIKLIPLEEGIRRYSKV
jgi:UDP-glucose 4-epimerase